MPSANQDLIAPAAAEADVSSCEDASPGYAGVERRRPGRAKSVSPELVGLLRQPGGTKRFSDVSDALRAPTGIAVAVVLSLVIWAALFVGIRALFF